LCEKRKPTNSPHASRKALQESIQGSRHARKFIARFVEALLQVRTSNLVKIAAATRSSAEADSVYRQTQRFLKNENRISIDYLKLLKIKGKLKILIDRTEWKFGETWINILTLSVAYKNVAIPILWEVAGSKGKATAARHTGLLKRFVAEFGVRQIERVYADREFGSYELFAYLIEQGIDFHIRLKTSHKSADKSFLKRWKQVQERVKLRGKVPLEVFGLEVFVSCVKYQKGGKTEYLIVASRRSNKYLI